MLRKEWPADTPFHKLLLTYDKISALSQWISRALKRKGWTVRKSTVSQKVPDNWVEVAQTESERICHTMLDANVDVLINSEETFFQFYPEVKHVVAPVGVKRVGSTNETNEKKGLTGMLGMELFSSSLFPPFLYSMGQQKVV